MKRVWVLFLIGHLHDIAVENDLPLRVGPGGTGRFVLAKASSIMLVGARRLR